MAVYSVGEGWTGALGTGHLDLHVPGHFDDELHEDEDEQQQQQDSALQMTQHLIACTKAPSMLWLLDGATRPSSLLIIVS